MRNKKISIFIFMFIILAVLTVSYFMDDNKPAQNIPQPQKTLETKTTAFGAVNVTVTPKNLFGNNKTWNFEIVLDTHSVELNQDLNQTVFLVDEKDNEYKPISWEGDSLGGHHRSGILKFQPINPPPSIITLKFKDFEDSDTRAFMWITEFDK